MPIVLLCFTFRYVFNVIHISYKLALYISLNSITIFKTVYMTDDTTIVPFFNSHIVTKGVNLCANMGGGVILRRNIHPAC